jgi:hypothetical protein
MGAIDIQDPCNFGQELINTAGPGGLSTGADVQLGEDNIPEENDTTLLL